MDEPDDFDIPDPEMGFPREVERDTDDEPIWRSAEGDEERLDEMESRHLLYAHRFVRRHPAGFDEEWEELLAAEIKRRGLRPLKE